MKRFALVLLLLASPVWAQDHTETVIAAKAQTTNEGKAQACEITARVVWMLRAEGYGHVSKSPAQNGCDYPGGKHAVDAVMLPDGRTWDILISAETENRPAWQVTGASDPGLWRAPFDVGDVPPVIIPPQPDTSHDAIVDLLGDFQEQANDKLDAILEQGRVLAAKIDAIPPPVVTENWLVAFITSPVGQSLLLAVAAMLGLSVGKANP